ncbi:3-hydroxy-3-methylglutaryl-CoA lyase, partial [Xenorhabdus bovienii]|nr:3-hydroxy-3-methylglutaryl-CoA lyase [Xenorhabdus bovienii]
DLGQILTQLDDFQSHHSFIAAKHNLIDILMGIYNLNVDNKTTLEEGLPLGVNHVFRIIKSLQEATT